MRQNGNRLLHLLDLQFLPTEIAGVIAGIRALGNQIICGAVAAAADFFPFRNRHPFLVTLACVVGRPVGTAGFYKGTGRGFRRGGSLLRLRTVGHSRFCLFSSGLPAVLLLFRSRFIGHRRLVRTGGRLIWRRWPGTLFPLCVLFRCNKCANNYDKYNNFKNKTKHCKTPRYKSDRTESIF